MSTPPPGDEPAQPATSPTPETSAPAASSRLTGPKSINEVADLINKIVFSLCTIAIAAAGFLLNKSVDDGNRRRELYTFLADTPLQAVSPDEIKRVGFLKKVCSSYLGRVEDVGADELCKALPAPSAKTVAAVAKSSVAAADAAAQTGDPGAYLKTPQAAAQNDVVAATAPVVVVPDQRWFVVLATVPTSQPSAAAKLQQSIAKLVPADLIGNRSVSVYRTRISNSFAVTLGGGMSKADATQLAASIRRVPPFDDAFAQPDRDWTACDAKCLGAEVGR